MSPSLSADLMVTLHGSYIAFVLVGQLLILIGMVLKWSWIRNPWFRLGHALAIFIVVGEAALNFECPLTTWEKHLRLQAGQPFPLENKPNALAGSCWGQFLDSIIYFDAPVDALLPYYVGFAVIVVGTWLLAPPRMRRKKPLTAS
jgi:hypothetical protein